MDLPQTTGELFLVLSNPAVVAPVLSLFIEHLPIIQDESVPNWKKLLIVIAFAFGWSLFVMVGTPDGFAGTWFYTLIRTAFAFAGMMVVFNQLVNNTIPWVRDAILALFGRNTVTITASSSTSSGNTIATTTQPAETRTTLEGVGAA